MKKYIFIIDTENYAGNFERELVAYISGQNGECQMGKEISESYRALGLPDLSHLVRQVADDRNCLRPASIMPTPGWFNSGMGDDYRASEINDPAVLKAYVGSIKEYYKPLIKETKDMIKSGNYPGNWTKALAEKEIARHEKEISDAKALKQPHQYPSYMSVGLFLNDIPSPDIVKQFKERAKEYAQNEGITITGFRLIEETKTQTEIDLSKD